MATRRRGLSAAASRAFDALESALAVAAVRWPRRGVRLASTLGELRQRLSGHWPSAAEVAALFDLSPDPSARLARRIAGLEARNRLSVALLHRLGPGRLAALVGQDGESQDTRPAVLLTFHVGALQLLGEALDASRRGILLMRASPIYSPRPGQRFAFTEGGAGERAAALKAAVAHLETGGSVVVAADGESGSGVDVRCLGRRLALARGAFAMSRLTGSPILPRVARWEGAQVVVERGAPVASAEEAGRWLEDFLRRRPEQLGLGLLRQLLRAER
ncbi:MAG: hypothetical protein IPJ17_02420 [Holophagales bacterium]|nr:MAG: hypothetical protein IPJ17_02420 [Holophagales bacterium]